MGALNPRPLPGCHKLPRSTRSSAAWPGTAGAGGVVGGSFQLHLCLGKIPFHVAACDLSRRLCRRGASSGEQGEVLQPRAPSPLAQGKRQHLQKLLGTGRVLLRGVGMGSLASRGHPGRRPQPAPAWLLAVHGPQMASASPPWHAYRCGVDGSGASPGGVCRDSASLSPFRVPARSPAPGLNLHHREAWSLRPCTSSNFVFLSCALWRGQA